MSLYIGRDDNNNGILHITASPENSTDMKSGILNSTVFHNEFEFLTYDLIPVTMSCVSATYINRTVYMYRMNISLPDLNNFIAYEFLDSSMNLVDKGQVFWYDNSGYTNTTTTSYKGGGSYPNNIWAIGQINNYCKATAASTIRYVLKLYKSKPLTGSGVDIAYGNISVGGHNLLDFRYVYQGTLVESAYYPQITPLIQLIDASKVPGTLEITSSAANSTLITKGGVPVIDSSGQYISGTGISYNYNITIPANSSGNTAVFHTLPPNTVAKVIVNTKNLIVTSTTNITANIIFYASYPPYPHVFARVDFISNAGSMYFNYVMENGGGASISISIETWLQN